MSLLTHTCGEGVFMSHTYMHMWGMCVSPLVRTCACMMGRVCPLTHVHAYVGNVCVPSCPYMCMHDGESVSPHTCTCICGECVCPLLSVHVHA